MINETNLLSEREREILRLVATGLSNQQIANQLGISPNTVKVHLRNVFGKINVASRTEATMYAVRAGIVEVETANVAAQAIETVEGVPESPTIGSAPPEDPPAATAPVVIEEVPAQKPVPAPESIEVVRPTIEPQSVQVVGSRSVSRRSGMLWLALALTSILSIAAVVASARGLGWGAANPQPSAAASQAALSEATRWRTLASLSEPRAAFAVAGVAEQIFVIGGENDSGVLGSVERYDITFGSWTTLSAKPTPVTDVRAVVLGEKIYVPGGRTAADPQSITQRFERYDPRTDSWDQLADLPAPRSAYALAQIEGRLYLFGGWDGSSYRNEVFEFNPETNQWRERSVMPTPRAYADAVVINASVSVLGGENRDGELASNEVYTPAREGEQPWGRRPPMPQARSHFSAAIEPAFASIFVLGGKGANNVPLQYRSDLDRWELLSEPTESIGSQPGVVQQAGSLLVFGGKIAEDYSSIMQTYQAIYRIQNPVP